MTAWFELAEKLERLWHRLRWTRYWIQEGFRRLRRRRYATPQLGDPWEEQRSRPGLWVAIADAARKAG